MSGPAAGGATAGSAAHTADVALSQSDCPYRGLRAYTDLDSEFFFGREADTDLVVANLLSSRVTVLCGPSGVGKSSLLQAGVLRELRHVSEGAFSFLAADQVIAVYFASWRDDPLVDLGRAIGEALPDGPLRAEMLADRRELSVELVERIVDEYDADVYLLLDQLEELDLYQKGAAGDAIAAVLGAVIRAPRLRASVLLGIREDALAKLDRLERHVPGILNSYLRLDHLSEDGAREAIAGPLVRYNELRPPDQHVRIEPALVDALLVELRTGQVAVADAGTGVVDDDDATIETPFLQLVMTRLWAHDIGPDRADRDGANGAGGARVLRAATLTELGGAQNIVRTHLDEVMSELTDPQREVAAQVFRHLVTPSGTKIAHSAADLADYAGVADLDVLTELLERLASGRHRVLRPVAPPVDHPGPTRYEIFHDVMAPAILDWRRRYVAQRDRDAAERTLVEAKEAAEAKNRETRRKLRRSRLFSGVLVALLAITVVLGILVVQQRQASARADDQRRQADVSAALQGIESDPAASLHTALTAWEADPDSQVEDLLRRALDADGNRLTITTDAGSASSAEFSPDGSTLLAAGTDGRTTLYHAATGSELGELPLAEGQIPAIILWAGFSPQGSMVATLADDGTITVYDAATRQIVSTPDYGADTSVIKWGTHDDREVLLVSGQGEPLELWDPRADQRVASYGDSADHLYVDGALREDGERVVGVSRRKDDFAWWLVIWDAATGREIATSPVEMFLAYSPRFVSPTSDEVVYVARPTAEDNYRVTRWSATTAPTIGTGASLFDIDDGGRASPGITGDDSSNEAADEPTVGPTSGGEATGAGTIEAPLVSQLDFAPAVSEDNRLIAYVVGKWIALLDATTLTQVGSIPQQDEFVSDMAFSPDGSLIATALEDGSLTVWRGDSWNNQPVARLLGHQSTIYDVRFSAADPTQLVTAGADGTTRTWQLPERTVLTASGGWMPDADLNAAADAVVTADQFGHWWLLDENLDAVQDEYLGSTDLLLNIDVAADGGRFAAVIYQYGSPVIRDFGDEEARQLDEQNDYTLTQGPALNADGTQVAAADYLGRVVVWDVEKGTIVRKLEADSETFRTTAVTYVPGTGQLAAASGDGSVRIWDADSDVPARVVTSPTSAQVTAIAFSADGSQLFTVGGDHLLRAYDLTGDGPPREATAPATSIQELALSPDESSIAAAGADGTVYIWSTATLQQTGAVHRHGDAVTSVDFLPDGDRLLTASDDGTSLVFECGFACAPIDEVVQAAQQRDAQRVPAG